MAVKLFFLILLVSSGVIGDELKQVLILGRHNIRAPLTADLEPLTPKEWPKWSQDVGFLTTKGALMEEYLGEFMANEYRELGLLPRGCPKPGTVYVYANAPQRTVKTAEHFVKRAFKKCDIDVNFKRNVTMDPLFYPIIRNHTDSFKTVALKEMQTKLDDLRLDDSYKRLNEILDLKQSKSCKEKNICDLTEGNNVIYYQFDEEPNVSGPLKLANSVVDTFLMAYYDGELDSNIGWGQIQPDDWELFAKVTRENQNVRFNNTIAARDISRSLLQYIKKELAKESHKFVLLVGHDSNLNSVLAAMNFKPFKLDGQSETYPIGGKLVFEKWYDRKANRLYAKVKYVYLTTEQIRNGSRISKLNPPRSVVLEMMDCSINKKGYHPWENFVKVLGKL